MLTKAKIKIIAGSMIMGAMSGLVVPAYAANDAMLELLNILRQKGSITQDEYSILRGAATADKEKTEAIKSEVKEEVKIATKDLPKITTKEKLEIASQDGDFMWSIGGRLHLDSINFNDDVRDIGSGTQFRRARLEMGGTFWKNWQGKVQYDFTSSGRGGIRDMYVRWNGWKPASITVGNFKVPFSLEELTSSNNITFMERSLANAPVGSLLSRRVGIGAGTQIGKMFTVNGMVYSTGGTSAPGGSIDEGYGIGGRATFVPINDGTRLVHIGAAGTHLSASQNLRTLGFSSRPEAGFGLNMVQTGALGTVANPVEDVTMFGLEGAAMYGPASIQGEYIITDVSRRGIADVDFEGFYIQGSYLLTGESRRYSFGSGSFSNPKAKAVAGKGGIGAWELALRYSSLDLNDGPVTGGKLEDLTVGLNWYPHSNIRFMANYVTVLNNNTGPFANDEPSAFLFRAQTNW